MKSTASLLYAAISLLLFYAVSIPAQYLRHGTNEEDSSSDASNNNETATTVISLPLHAVSGTHHVNVYIGQPPQKQTLIVDTGSRLTATVCHPCRDCGSNHANRPFDPQASTTLQSVTCGHCQLESNTCSEHQHCILHQKYTEGSSWTAMEVNDIVTLASDTIDELPRYLPYTTVPFTFGCQQRMEGLFRKQYGDGILGLERSDFSIMHQFKRHGVLSRHAFSICASRTGGWLGLGNSGSAHRSLHQEAMQYTPISREHGWYSMEVQQVWLGDSYLITDTPELVQSFQNGKGTILDSGTTDTYLPHEIADRLSMLWEQLTGIPWNKRIHQYTWQEFERLPIVTLQMVHNVTLELHPIHYMEHTHPPNWSGVRELTNRLYTDEPAGAVLGLNAMMDYDIHYDSDGGRIGIAKANCDDHYQSNS